MFDVIPWFDEVFIVEMGRIFFCGGNIDGLFISGDGVVSVPICYIGPAIQECAFRLFGQTGVRLSPWLGLAVLWLEARVWFRKTSPLVRHDIELLALALATAPLLFQSALLARIDTWALALVFAALATLGTPGSKRSRMRIAIGAAFASLTVFIWPSSLMLAPLYPTFCFDWKHRQEFLLFCLFAVASAIVVSIPILPHLHAALATFSRHSNEATAGTPSFLDVGVEFAREFARAPFLMSLSFVGFIVWMRERRYMAISAFLFALALGVATRLYAFRFLYLTPFFLFMCADAAIWLRGRSQRILRRLLWMTVAYAVITGPIGHCFLQYPTLPDGLKEDLSTAIGPGPKMVFAPDFATYYIGRELGWRQLIYTSPQTASDSDLVRATLSRADAVVLRDWDPYETTQQSCTPYGLFCKYVLLRAKQEKDLPDANKSWFAKIGSRFAGGWHAPIKTEGFSEAGRFGMIRIFRKIKKHPSYE